MIELTNKIQSILQADPSLAYIADSNIYTHADEREIIKAGKYPFVNIHGVDETIRQSKTFKFHDAYEKVLKVELSIYTASKTYTTVYNGTSTVKGIWTVKDDVWSVLYANRHIRVDGINITRDMLPQSSIRSYYGRFTDGIHWAKATIELSYIRDVFTA